MPSLYRRLDKSDIRLLTIRSHKAANVVCELQTYPRTYAPDYDAVTYVWGDDPSVTLVVCNGYQLSIRSSLFRALPLIHGSRPKPKRPLWIDALCLNQKDDIEKATHVPLMGSIYENAKRTLVWFGESAENSDQAIRSMPSLTRTMLTVDPDQVSYALSHEEDLTVYGLPAKDDPLWHALQVLQLRPWFSRLWTLQEIVLSREAIILCGTEAIPWEHLPRLQDAALRAGLVTLAWPATDSETFANSGTIVLTKQIEQFRKFREKGTRIALNPYVAIWLSMHRKYTEPVDRYWAILGLMDERFRLSLQKADLIQYTPTAIQNYHETCLGFMKLVVEQEPRSAMLLLAQGVSQNKNPQLPSWCPDWHLKQVYKPVSEMEGIAAGISNRPVITLDGGSSVEVLGLPIAAIATTSVGVGQFWVNYFDRNSNPDRARVSTSCTWVTECLAIVRDRADEAAADALGTDATVTPVDPLQTLSILELCKKLGSSTTALKTLLFPSESPTALFDFGSLVSWCNGRKFFRTQKGNFGLGPPNLREGDLVCAFYGSNPLFVLRQVKYPSLETFKREIPHPRHIQGFQVVGDAYMPGLMNGEVLQGESCEAMRHFKLV